MNRCSFLYYIIFIDQREANKVELLAGNWLPGRLGMEDWVWKKIDKT
jgi:hypothetical protein